MEFVDCDMYVDTESDVGCCVFLFEKDNEFTKMHSGLQKELAEW